MFKTKVLRQAVARNDFYASAIIRCVDKDSAVIVAEMIKGARIISPLESKENCFQVVFSYNEDLD